MGQDLQEDAAILRGIVAQLNAAAAEATAVVSAVDVFLGEDLSIGVSAASRPFSSERVVGDDGSEQVVTAHLAFGRVQGKDRLHVLKTTHAKNEWQDDFSKAAGEERTPWSACAREVKLQSFAKLPELLAALAARVEEVTSQTTRTVESVRSLIEAMKTPHQAETTSVEITTADEVADDYDLRRDVSLQELTATVAPTLFKRPRPKSGAA